MGTMTKVFVNKKTKQLLIMLKRKEIEAMIGKKDPKFIKLKLKKKDFRF